MYSYRGVVCTWNIFFSTMHVTILERFQGREQSNTFNTTGLNKQRITLISIKKTFDKRNLFSF